MPIHTMCGSATADHANLKAIADRSGGQVAFYYSCFDLFNVFVFFYF